LCPAGHCSTVSRAGGRETCSSSMHEDAATVMPPSFLLDTQHGAGVAQRG
jgi:hypothetical protein